MRQVMITRIGPPEVLAIQETPEPQPGPGQVRVRVAFAGINFADIMARVGLYPDAPPLPACVGYETSGTVDAIGPGVTRHRVGDQVLAMSRFGGYAEAIVVDEVQALPLPGQMSLEEGAALPVTYLTAHHMLFHVQTLHPGERILIHGAAGGVGIAATQLARTVPGVTIFGTASASKHAFLQELGVDHCIDYRNEDFYAAVREKTSGEGVDVVLDAVGGSSFRKGWKLLRPAGRLLMYGMSAMAQGEGRNPLAALAALVQTPFFHPIPLMNANRSAIGINMGHLWDQTHVLLPQLDRILDLYREGKIRPHVDKVFPFTEAAAAHRFIQDRKNVGKVLLCP